MNLSRYRQVRQSPTNFGLIASYLDTPSLETVTANEGPQRRTGIETIPENFPDALKLELRREWPQEAAAAYADAGTKRSLIIPDFGPTGTIVVSTDRIIHIWTIRAHEDLSRYSSYMPVNADVLQMCCVAPVVEPYTALKQRLLVVAYPAEICAFTLRFRDDVMIHLASTTLATETTFITSAMCVGKSGRVFVGSREGLVYEFRYGTRQLLGFPMGNRCSLRLLDCRVFPLRERPNSPVQKMIIDEQAHMLIALSADNWIQFYDLGTASDATPSLRKIYRVPAALVEHSRLLTIVPMIPDEQNSFRGMLVFSDGNRMMATLKYEAGPIADRLDRFIGLGSTTEFSCGAVLNKISPLVPQWKLTSVTPSPDGEMWLLSEEEGRASFLSVLQFIDSDPRKRAENGAIFYRDQIPSTHPPLAIAACQPANQSSLSDFCPGEDLVSRQLNPPDVSHIILDAGGFTVVRTKSASELLKDIVLANSERDFIRHMKGFIGLFGSVETAAMLCLIGNSNLSVAKSIFSEDELFGTAKMVTKTRSHRFPSSPANFDGQMAAENSIFGSEATEVTETDIEYSDAFKGFILILRQILKTVWWVKPFRFSQDELDSSKIRVEKTRSLDGWAALVNSLNALHQFISHHIVQFDPRVGDWFYLTSEANQYEVNIVLSIMHLLLRSVNAVMLLGNLQRSDLTQLAEHLSEQEREALNEMSFNRLVFTPNESSPINPLIQAHLIEERTRSMFCIEAMQYLENECSTFWSADDSKEYEAMRRLELECANPDDEIDTNLYIISGPNRNLPF